ncbi:MAG: 6-phosphofructokinase [Acidobacteriota bacterium]
MTPQAKRIGVLTGGGDCAGLNAVIRAVVRTAHNFGWEVLGIQDSFEGLINRKKSGLLRPRHVRGILHTGGTILGTTNRGNPFKYPVQSRSRVMYKDLSNVVVRNARALKLEGLVVIGGEGTLSIALEFHRRGVPVVGVPKTIDNDVSATAITFGFDTAVSVATEALDRLHTTAFSHRRVMVLEVMGRNAGWIALHAGVAGGADVILIPEIPFDMAVVVQKIRERDLQGRRFSIVVVAEGAAPVGGGMLFRERREAGNEARLGGIGQLVASQIAERTNHETRSLSLGHIQRGGRPTNFDRLLGTRFGSAAVRLAHEGKWGRMVALAPPSITSVPLERAVSRKKRVPMNSDIIRAARDLGISFGETVCAV